MIAFDDEKRAARREVVGVFDQRAQDFGLRGLAADVVDGIAQEGGLVGLRGVESQMLILFREALFVRRKFGGLFGD